MKRHLKKFPENIGDAEGGGGCPNFELQRTTNVFDHFFLKKHRPKVKFMCFMDIYLLKGTFQELQVIF